VVGGFSHRWQVLVGVRNITGSLQSLVVVAGLGLLGGTTSRVLLGRAVLQGGVSPIDVGRTLLYAAEDRVNANGLVLSGGLQVSILLLAVIGGKVCRKIVGNVVRAHLRGFAWAEINVLGALMRERSPRVSLGMGVRHLALLTTLGNLVEPTLVADVRRELFELG